MPLQIVGAAFPRTGTFSLKLALEHLGFGPCHHMAEVLSHPESAHLWMAAADGKPDWDTIFKDYRSNVDGPSCFFFQPIYAHYPNARVILTERDPDEWFDSTQATIFSPFWIETITKLPPPLNDFFGKVQGPLRAHLNDRAYMTGMYRSYCDAVKGTVPAEKLLVLKMGAGWEPLCGFLGVPAPDVPYPKSNTRDELKAMMALMAEQGPNFDFEAVAQKTQGRPLIAR